MYGFWIKNILPELYQIIETDKFLLIDFKATFFNLFTQCQVRFHLENFQQIFANEVMIKIRESTLQLAFKSYLT